MLNDKNPYQTDPDSIKYAFNCGLILLVAVCIIGMTTYYFDGIYSVIKDSFLMVGSSIASISNSVFEFVKGVFVTAGLYLMWTFMVVTLWTACVMSKIGRDYVLSRNRWKRATITSLILYIITTLFVIILGFQNPSHNIDHLTIYTICLICVVFFEVLFLLGHSSEHRK